MPFVRHADALLLHRYTPKRASRAIAGDGLAFRPANSRQGRSSDLGIGAGIASAVSIALTTTVLQNRLAERVLLLVQDQNAMPLEAEALLQHFFLTFKHLGDFTDIAQIKAMATLQQLFSAEAALHSYHDTFILIGWMSAAGILPALWMGHAKSKAAKASPLTPSPQDTAPLPSSAVPYTPAIGGEKGTRVDSSIV